MNDGEAGLPVQHLTLGAAGGTPVVMLHGWGARLELLRPLGERLAPLGYRLYIPDLPGFGGTPPPPTAWDVQVYAALVLAYLDALGLARVHLFGHSFGGRLGLVLGAAHADRLDKLVLADSAGVRPRVSPAAQARLRAYKALRGGLRRAGLAAQADQLSAWYSGRYGSADYQQTAGVMRETFVRVVNQDLLPYAARVAVPTLLLWGERDEDTPVWQGRLLEQTIPDAGLVLLSGAGHYSYLDRLPEAVRVIDYFFRH